MRPPPARLASYYRRFNPLVRHTLSASNADCMPLAELLDLAEPAEMRLWEGLSLGYAQFLGHPELRAAVAEDYGDCAPEHVLTFAGAQEAMLCAYLAVLEPGDHVVTCRPCYEFLETIPEWIGAEVTTVALRSGATGFSLDLDDLRAALRPDTRLIAINFPHNPTGAHISLDTLEQIVELARERNAWLLSDEVFRLLTHGGRPPLPPVASLYEKGISLNVMSKSFGLGGVRVGWIVSQSAAAVEGAAGVKVYSSICNGTADEILALIALRAKDRILETNIERIERNIAIATERLADHRDRIVWTPPTAGCLAFPEVTTSESADDLAERMASDAGLLILPAPAFLSDENRFRMGLGLETFPEALDLLLDHVIDKGA